MRPIHTLTFALLIILTSGISLVFAWTGPTQTPPGGNVSAPINIGTTDQVKNGGLSVNSLAVFGNVLISGVSKYLNFGTIAGSIGYGIRDNAGVVEVKNSGGDWSQVVVTTSGSGTVGRVPKFGTGPSLSDSRISDTGGSVAIEGELKISSVGTVCSSLMEGGIRYNATGKKLEFCDGTAWCPLDGCSASGSKTIITSQTFTIPTYTSLSVQCWGAGGGGAGDGSGSSNGSAGGASTFLSLSAGGGLGGYDNSGGGAGGSASGGQSNINGAAGGPGTSVTSGAGGTAPNGGQGAPGVGSNMAGLNGSIPGGGASGGKGAASGSGGGGSGGYASRTYVLGELTPGSTVSVVIGSGGNGGSGGYPGGVGARGECRIDWN